MFASLCKEDTQYRRKESAREGLKHAHTHTHTHAQCHIPGMNACSIHVTHGKISESTDVLVQLAIDLIRYMENRRRERQNSCGDQHTCHQGSHNPSPHLPLSTCKAAEFMGVSNRVYTSTVKCRVNAHGRLHDFDPNMGGGGGAFAWCRQHYLRSNHPWAYTT